jgi:hypothetical protein
MAPSPGSNFNIIPPSASSFPEKVSYFDDSQSILYANFYAPLCPTIHSTLDLTTLIVLRGGGEN